MKREVIEKISYLITTAFGLIAALAWNDAIKAIFVQVFGEAKTLWPLIIYAAIVTIIAIIVTIWIGRVTAKREEQ